MIKNKKVLYQFGLLAFTLNLISAPAWADGSVADSDYEFDAPPPMPCLLPATTRPINTGHYFPYFPQESSIKKRPSKSRSEYSSSSSSSGTNISHQGSEVGEISSLRPSSKQKPPRFAETGSKTADKETQFPEKIISPSKTTGGVTTDTQTDDAALKPKPARDNRRVRFNMGNRPAATQTVAPAPAKPTPAPRPPVQANSSGGGYYAGYSPYGGMGFQGAFYGSPMMMGGGYSSMYSPMGAYGQFGGMSFQAGMMNPMMGYGGMGGMYSSPMMGYGGYGNSMMGYGGGMTTNPMMMSYGASGYGGMSGGYGQAGYGAMGGYGGMGGMSGGIGGARFY